METDVVGAVKIVDGIFAGDAFAARDKEFVVTCKVKYIINACGTEVPAYWKRMGVKYLRLDWSYDKDFSVLDAFDDCFNFIE